MRLTRDGIYLLIIVLLLALCGQFYYSYRYQPTHQIQVYYNKDTEVNRKIIQTIQNADKFVYFAIYTFTRSDIKDALLGAKHRGLDVQGVTDRDQLEKIDDQKKIIKELRDADIPVSVQDHSAIMHMKTVVTDKSYASGSYNWTTAATNSNDEVLEVGKDEGVRSQYEKVVREVLEKYKP